MSDDPTRLLDLPPAEANKGVADAHDFLRGALAAGRADLPDARAMDALAAKIGPLLGGPPPGAPPPPAAPLPPAVPIAGAAGIKAIAAFATIGALFAGGAFYAQRGPESVPLPLPATSLAPAASGAIGASSPPATATVAEPAAPVPVASSLAATAPPTAKPAAPERPEVEVRLLQRAQDALRASPSDALALCAEHARRYPRGTLAQEREVIAVDALVRLHRDDEARSRGARFRTEWPNSSHLRRVDALLEKNDHNP